MARQKKIFCHAREGRGISISSLLSRAIQFMIRKHHIWGQEKEWDSHSLTPFCFLLSCTLFSRAQWNVFCYLTEGLVALGPGCTSILISFLNVKHFNGRKVWVPKNIPFPPSNSKTIKPQKTFEVQFLLKNSLVLLQKFPYILRETYIATTTLTNGKLQLQPCFKAK